MAPKVTPEQQKEALEIQKLELEIAHLRFRAEKQVADYERDMATADAARVYPLTGEISSTSVKYAIDRLTEWFRHSPDEPIEIVINSGGGSLFAGMALFDYIQIIRGAGCPVTTTAVGMAASMAGILLQAGSTRVMSEHAYLMIHEASTATWGKISELRDEVELIDRVEERMLAILAERSTMSAKQIKAKSARKDWWLDSREALKYGFIDDVR